MEPTFFTPNNFNINDLNFITERTLKENEHFKLKEGEIKIEEEKTLYPRLRSLTRKASKCFKKGTNGPILTLLEKKKDLFPLLSFSQLQKLQINLKSKIEEETRDLHKKERAIKLQKKIIVPLLIKQPKFLAQLAIDITQQIICKIKVGHGRIDSFWLLRFEGMTPSLKPLLQRGIEAVKDYDVFQLYDHLKKIIKELPSETTQDFLSLKQAKSVDETITQINKLPGVSRTLAISLISLLHEAFEKIWSPEDQQRNKSDRKKTLNKMLRCPVNITELLCPSIRIEPAQGLFCETSNTLYLAEILKNYTTYYVKLKN
jgi:hypothetical protein